MTTRVIGWLIKNNLFRFDDNNYLYELWYRTVVLYIFSSIYDIQNSASSSHISGVFDFNEKNKVNNDEVTS